LSSSIDMVHKAWKLQHVFWGWLGEIKVTLVTCMTIFWHPLFNFWHCLGVLCEEIFFLTLLLLSYLMYRHIQATLNQFKYNFVFASIFETLYLFKLLILVLEIVKNEENATKLNLVIWSVIFFQNILTFDGLKESFISYFFHIQLLTC
jgi:hypothetical protein